MDRPLTPLTRLLLWDYGRTSRPYVALCLLLLVLMIFVPPAWVADPMAALP
jgi:hypothetical protein